MLESLIKIQFINLKVNSNQYTLGEHIRSISVYVQLQTYECNHLVSLGRWYSKEICKSHVFSFFFNVYAKRYIWCLFGYRKYPRTYTHEQMTTNPFVSTVSNFLTEDFFNCTDSAIYIYLATCERSPSVYIA